MIRSVRVASTDGGYDVVVNEGGFEGLSAALVRALPDARRWIVLTEPRVADAWQAPLEAALSGLDVQVIRLDAQETDKTVATWSAATEQVLALNPTRQTPILALGGGVLSDVAGFVAATALRGLPFVALPTTLLAMVDASVGGKTGVNHRDGKNRIGAFHPPRLVWAATKTLSTLPIRELRSGLAEAVKAALIGDPIALDRLEAGVDLAGAELASLVVRAVAVKAAIVSRDPNEQGERRLLNAGHTVGHALEAALGYGALLHGEAVAIGLVAELQAARSLGVLEDSALVERVGSLLATLRLPTTAPEVDPDRLLAALCVDKKSVGATVSVPLAVRAGQFRIVPVTPHLLAQTVGATGSSPQGRQD